MIKISKISIILSAVSALVLLGASSMVDISVAADYSSQGAIDQLCQDPNTCPVKTPGDIFNILAAVLRYTYTIFFIVAIIFILVAAFSFLNAKGDPNAIIAARSQIVWAVVAIIVALLSVGAAQIINNFLSSPA